MLRILMSLIPAALPPDQRPASPPLRVQHSVPISPVVKSVRQVPYPVKPFHSLSASRYAQSGPMLFMHPPFSLMNASAFSTAARMELEKQADQAASDLVKKWCREMDSPRTHWVDTLNKMNGIDLINTSKISLKWLDHHPVKQLNIILRHAANMGDWQCKGIQAILLDESLPPNYKRHCLANVLSVAAMHGHTAFVNFLLEKGALIDERYENVEGTWAYREQLSEDEALKGSTPLLCAVMHRHRETAGLLIDLGADVNRQATLLPVNHPDFLHYANVSSLHFAAANDDEAMVNLLLRNGALIDAENAFGETPLLFAVWKGHKGMVRLLLEHGADSQHQSRWGVSMHTLTEDMAIKDLLHGNSRNILTMRLS